MNNITPETLSDMESAAEDDIIRHSTIPNLWGTKKWLEEWDDFATELMTKWEMQCLWGKPKEK